MSQGSSTQSIQVIGSDSKTLSTVNKAGTRGILVVHDLEAENYQSEVLKLLSDIRELLMEALG